MSSSLYAAFALSGTHVCVTASHLYITQHEPTRGSIRGVVNLEACGVSGPELLFQASSEELLRGYAQARRPFGTVLAK